MLKLRELYIRGFTSFDGERGARIPFGDVTVLLGANGAGKSNLVSFFRMLHCLAEHRLSDFIGEEGGSRLLFYGPKKTSAIQFTVFFDDGADNRYEMLLKRRFPEGLFISQEKISFDQFNPAARVNWRPKHQTDPSGNTFASDFYYLPKNENGETGLSDSRGGSESLIYKFLKNIAIYQFSDTSDTARLRDRCYVDDARQLKGDAGNLAAFLKMLRGNAAYRKYYDRIVYHIRRVMPQFGDFDLESIPGAADYVRLNWRDSSGSEYLFDPHQISDGSLRFMALAALLLQPPELMPKFIILDEPELGLHPAALSELRAMVRSASRHAQVLIATQSPRLVDEFSPDEVVIVERDANLHSSVFRKLDSEALADWLARYSLSELWEKNVIGGQP